MINFLKYLQSDYWILKKYQILEKQILSLWKKKYSQYSDKQLKSEAQNLRNSYQKHKDLNQLLVPSYALACEVILRLKKISLHPVQILAGIVLHFGNVAELKTGEGKTLASTLPAYLNSFVNKSIFIVTVNEYLVQRDCKDNEEIFKFLGLTVGKTLNNMKFEEKMINYRANIVYGTNSEFGFDYLRDNMLPVHQRKIQLNHYFVIIDEVDSVLIDEGRTPLIISGKPKDRSKWYHQVDKFVKSLNPSDYKIDIESRRCFLQPSGIVKANNFFSVNNLFNLNNSLLFHGIMNSLQANYVLQNNIDYLVKNKKIMLIDQFTGRIMADRMLSEGLHQSVEAKENCNIQNETNILATITYQNFFRIFDKISGMTGTAKNEEEEFINIFNMHVLKIPTHKPIIRNDDNDYFFYDQQSKYSALIKHIQKIHSNQQPILIGTCSVQISENIGKILKRMGFKFNLLNAKRFEEEAQIIAKAGIHNSITIATNMAGRGTDIKLDEKARTVGGLAILGVERNESRRIDLQLQGRSGRQGDPGYSAFYISLDDPLFRRFDNKNLRKQFAGLKNQLLKSNLLDHFIKKAQNKLQNSNFEQRKNMLEYDNVISQQRQVVYRQRDFIIKADLLSLKKYLVLMFNNFFKIIWNRYFSLETLEINEIQLYEFIEHLKKLFGLPEIDFKKRQTIYIKVEVLEHLELQLWNYYNDKIMNSGSIFVSYYNKVSLIEIIDDIWTVHLDELFRLKSSTFLHSYAQKKPLQIFITEANTLFKNLKNKIIFEATRLVFLNWKRIKNIKNESEKKQNNLQPKNKSISEIIPKIKITKKPEINNPSSSKKTTKTA